MKKIIQKAFRYRIYPTAEQEKIFASHFGQARFVYNHFLRERIDYYAENKGGKEQSLTYHDTSKMLTELKKEIAFSWLKESNSQSLQQSLRHLDTAYTNFFRGRAQFPHFKKKNNKQSISIPQHFSIDTETQQLNIPKMMPLKIVLHRPTEGKMKSITVSKMPSGRYFASIFCEVEIDVEQKQVGKEIGIDLGLKSFLVMSDGETVDPPKFFRESERKLKHLQRQLSRKTKGSSRRNKARIKVARIHEKIANQRNDFLHKLSHRLVTENQSIFAESLNVKGMVKNHCLAKSISDAGWSDFIRQINYKAEWEGTHFGQINRWFPSSKRHYECGWINDSLTLSDREWTCLRCGNIVDRDENASKNILQFGKLEQIGLDESKLTLREITRSKADR